MSQREFRLRDTMSGQVKPLTTAEPGHLRFYTCGPTVYSYAHIGNFRSFLAADLVVRTARALGWKVTWVVNITDVGHLTQDDVADAGGEDRMEKALKSKEGEQFANVWDLAEYYASAYIEDWKRLNLTEPSVRPRATQHVREQILMVEDLIARKHAYETPTGVYFDVDSKSDYGKLSGNRRDNLKEAVREVVRRLYGERYLSLPHATALRLLYTRPKIHLAADTLIDPRTLQTFHTLAPGDLSMTAAGPMGDPA